MKYTTASDYRDALHGVIVCSNMLQESPGSQLYVGSAASSANSVKQMKFR